jgi:hypothetical protein
VADLDEAFAVRNGRTEVVALLHAVATSAFVDSCRDEVSSSSRRRDVERLTAEGEASVRTLLQARSGSSLVGLEHGSANDFNTPQVFVAGGPLVNSRPGTLDPLEIASGDLRGAGKEGEDGEGRLKHRWKAGERCKEGSKRQGDGSLNLDDFRALGSRSARPEKRRGKEDGVRFSEGRTAFRVG